MNNLQFADGVLARLCLSVDPQTGAPLAGNQIPAALLNPKDSHDRY